MGTGQAAKVWLVVKEEPRRVGYGMSVLVCDIANTKWEAFLVALSLLGKENKPSFYWEMQPSERQFRLNECTTLEIVGKDGERPGYFLMGSEVER